MLIATFRNAYCNTLQCLLQYFFRVAINVAIRDFPAVNSYTQFQHELSPRRPEMGFIGIILQTTAYSITRLSISNSHDEATYDCCMLKTSNYAPQRCNISTR